MKIKIGEFNGLELFKDDQDGYSFRSTKTGAVYDVLEGKSFHGATTSDIIFIMRAIPGEGYTNLVNFCFGASFADDALDSCVDYITEYENGERMDLQAEF